MYKLDYIIRVKRKRVYITFIIGLSCRIRIIIIFNFDDDGALLTVVINIHDDVYDEHAREWGEGVCQTGVYFYYFYIVLLLLFLYIYNTRVYALDAYIYTS